MQKEVAAGTKEKYGGQKKKLLTDSSEIKNFNAEITKLFKHTGLLLRPGCLLKTNQEYYENYGFKATPENKKELLKEINKFYDKDREDEAEEKTINPRGLIIQPYNHYTNIVVDWIAKITKKIIEKKQILEKYDLEDFEQLPKFKSDDPSVRALGAKPGDVVKIYREDATGKYVAYRYVVSD